MLTGCASLTSGRHQGVTFETIRADGQVVNGAECIATNSRRTMPFRSGPQVQVRRDKGDLYVKCTSNGLPSAEGQLISSENFVGVGNILVGGLVGMAVDGGTGASRKYPAWVRLVFGEYRRHDPRTDKTREPMLGTLVSATALLPAPQEPAATPTAADTAAQPAVQPTPAPAAAAPEPAPVPNNGVNWRAWGEKTR